jgi:hypothetical protein
MQLAIQFHQLAATYRILTSGVLAYGEIQLFKVAHQRFYVQFVAALYPMPTFRSQLTQANPPNAPTVRTIRPQRQVRTLRRSRLPPVVIWAVLQIHPVRMRLRACFSPRLDNNTWLPSLAQRRRVPQVCWCLKPNAKYQIN